MNFHLLISSSPPHMKAVWQLQGSVNRYLDIMNREQEASSMSSGVQFWPSVTPAVCSNVNGIKPVTSKANQSSSQTTNQPTNQPTK